MVTEESGFNPIGIPLAAISRQMERILASPGFARSSRMSRFLRLVVDETLRNPGAELKEYHIATQVFDKPDTFDPRTDSIVRVEARRLRFKLRQYAEQRGRNDTLEITLSPRRYIAIIRERTREKPRPVSSGQPAAPRSKSVAVQPFLSLSAGRAANYFSRGLTEELIHAMSKLSSLKVLSWDGRGATASSNIREMAASLKVDAVLEGSVRIVAGTMRISAQLVSMADGALIFSQMYQRKAKDVFADQDEICRSIIASLTSGLGLDKERAAADVKREPPAASQPTPLISLPGNII